MEELLSLFGVGAGSVGGSILYSKWSIGQHRKELDILTRKVDGNENKDSIRDTKIAVMQEKIQGVEVTIASRLDSLSESIKDLKEDIKNLKT